MAGGDDLPGHKNIAKNGVLWDLLRGPIRPHFRRADLGVGDTPEWQENSFTVFWDVNTMKWSCLWLGEMICRVTKISQKMGFYGICYGAP